jgi:uncharacterized paraquat-inducible protein A
MFKCLFCNGDPKVILFSRLPECDALFSAPVLLEGERVVCPRCRGNLLSRRPNFVHRATALVLAAVIFFIAANAFPLLTLRADYRESYIISLAACRDWRSRDMWCWPPWLEYSR